MNPFFIFIGRVNFLRPDDSHFNDHFVSGLERSANQLTEQKNNLDNCKRICYHMAMIITIDTNVLFSALNSSEGASHLILKLIINEEVQFAITPSTYFEYYDVLTRPENLANFNLTISEIEDVLDLLALLAKKHEVYFLQRPNLIDEKDNIFIECAFASNSDFLITSNVRDFMSGELKYLSFDVVTPSDFIKYWRNKNV